eukprot:6192362-Pleurochrysis_carterae.AAC.2
MSARLYTAKRIFKARAHAVSPCRRQYADGPASAHGYAPQYTVSTSAQRFPQASFRCAHIRVHTPRFSHRRARIYIFTGRTAHFREHVLGVLAQGRTRDIAPARSACNRSLALAAAS